MDLIHYRSWRSPSGWIIAARGGNGIAKTAKWYGVSKARRRKACERRRRGEDTVIDYRTIVVALDFSENSGIAFNVGVGLAKQYGAKRAS